LIRRAEVRNILLNIPHMIIGGVILFLAYRGRANVPVGAAVA
jgi:hypothetical protein